MIWFEEFWSWNVSLLTQSDWNKEAVDLTYFPRFLVG